MFINHTQIAPRTSRDHTTCQERTHTADLCVTFDIITLICYINCLQAVALREHLFKTIKWTWRKKAIGSIIVSQRNPLKASYYFPWSLELNEFTVYEHTVTFRTQNSKKNTLKLKYWIVSWICYNYNGFVKLYCSLLFIFTFKEAVYTLKSTTALNCESEKACASS